MADVMSLVKAIQDKYCPVEPEVVSDIIGADCIHSVQQSGLFLAPGGCPLERRRSVVLEGRGVCYAGEGPELERLCPLVEELHLCGNQLVHWRDILTILNSLPHLKFLDLTKNPLLSEQVMADNGHSYTHLSTLVLNHTGVEWVAVETCLQLAPNLTELHLAHNGYSTVTLDPQCTHSSLKRLQIQCNTFKEWTELIKLSHAFPTLHTLIASDNPLTKITPMDSAIFAELALLALNNTLINDWESFEHLAVLSKLSELNVLRVPIAEAINNDKIRRFAIIARMPALKRLSKSSVSPTEREEAERWLLREFEDKEDRPGIYCDYLEKHGVLDKLANVDLSPRKSVQLEFHFEDGHDSVTRSVQLNQTIAEFRSWVATELVGVASANVRLIYVDCMGWEGMQVLAQGGRKLYCYREIRDGDQIHVQILPKK